MNNKELELAKSKYSDLMLLKQKLEQAKIQKEKFEEDPLIKEYLELINFISLNEQKVESDNIILECFDDLARKTVASSKIYVCIGRYLFNVKNGKITSESGGYPWDAKEYRDIETMKSICVSIDKIEEFEKQNKIIFLEKEKEYGGASRNKFYNNKFKEIRKMYLKILLENSEEKSVQKILSIYKNNNFS